MYGSVGRGTEGYGVVLRCRVRVKRCRKGYKGVQGRCMECYHLFDPDPYFVIHEET